MGKSFDYSRSQSLMPNQKADEKLKQTLNIIQTSGSLSEEFLMSQTGSQRIEQHADELERAEIQQPVADLNSISNVDIRSPTNVSPFEIYRTKNLMKGPPASSQSFMVQHERSDISIKDEQLNWPDKLNQRQTGAKVDNIGWTSALNRGEECHTAF